MWLWPRSQSRLLFAAQPTPEPGVTSPHGTRVLPHRHPLPGHMGVKGLSPQSREFAPAGLASVIISPLLLRRAPLPPCTLLQGGWRPRHQNPQLPRAEGHRCHSRPSGDQADQKIVPSRPPRLSLLRSGREKDRPWPPLTLPVTSGPIRRARPHLSEPGIMGH